MAVLVLALSAIFGYLIGAIPMGVLISDFHSVDIAKHGSGRTGTTNVLRTIGRRAAGLVLAGDVLKGLAAVLIARLLVAMLANDAERLSLFNVSFSLTTAASLLAAAGAMSGHVWSIYLRLLQGRWLGGRAVATAMGAVLAVNPLIILAAVGVGLPTMLVTRYVSLGSILGATAGGVSMVVLVLFGQLDLLAILFLFVPLFIIFSHRDNIERLLKGTERKLGEKALQS